MKNFVAENDCILEEWRNAYVNNNQSEYPDCTNLHEYFTPDGIMFKGDFLPDRRNYSDGKSVFRWKRNCSGEENTLWTRAPLRVLFLTKDYHFSYLRFDYVGMISAYHEFLKKHPDFTESHRK